MKWLINWRDWDPETGPAVTGERGWPGLGWGSAWLDSLTVFSLQSIEVSWFTIFILSIRNVLYGGECHPLIYNLSLFVFFCGKVSYKVVSNKPQPKRAEKNCLRLHKLRS